MNRKSTILATILFFISSLLSIHAQEQSLLRNIMRYTMPTSLTAGISDGEAFWVGNDEGVRNVFYYDGTNTIQLTNYQKDDGMEITNLIPTPDGKSVIYFIGGSPNRQGIIANPTTVVIPFQREIYKVDLSSRTQEKLIDGYGGVLSHKGRYLAYLSAGDAWLMDMENENKVSKIFDLRGGTGDLTWSPGDDKIAFVSNRGDHSFIGIYTLANEEINFLDPSVDNDSNPIWSPDGSKIAFIRQPSVSGQIPFIPQKEGFPWSIMMGDASSGSATKIWTADKGYGSIFRFISGDKQIFWGAGDYIVFPWEKNGFTNLYSVSIKDKKVNALSPGNFEVQFVSISKDKNQILYSSNENDTDRQHIWSSEVNGTSRQQLTEGGIEWSPVDTGNKLFFLASNGVTPAHPAMLENGNVVALHSIQDYPTQELVEPEQVIFTAADGKKIHAQLFLPKNINPGEKKPAVVFFHGGSRRQMLLGFHHRGYYHNAYAFNQFLASQGYVVLSVNYRSGIGYGLEFREAEYYGANGASEFNDVLGAGLYLQNRKDVDPSRIGLWGGSYGGYLTAMGLSRAPEMFKAGVDIHGAHDWNKIIQNFVPSYNPLERPEVAQLAYESSPVSSLEGWKAPVLFIHGDDDRNVPFSETVEIIEVLRNQDVEIEQLIFPDEVHGFLLHSNWVNAYEAAFDFFQRKL